MRPRWLLGLVAPLLGCGPAGAFPCLVDDDCVTGAQRGTCQPAGFCSFPDEDCASGQRFGAHAGGGLAQACVDAGTTTAFDETTRGESSALVTTTLDSTASNTETTGTTADTTMTISTTEPTTGGACPDDWADCGLSTRRPLLILGLEEAVDGFAVPWRFDFAELAGDSTQSPDRLRFTDLDGALLPFDLESSEVGGEAIAWIRVPKIQGVTQIYVYYGGVPLTPMLPAVDVWTPEYVEVWHGDGTPGRVMGLVLEEDAIMYAGGEFGLAATFDGEDSRLRTEALQLFPPTVTISAWTYARSFGEITFARIFDTRNGPAGGAGFSVVISDVNENVNTLSMVHGCTGGDAEWVAPDDTIVLDAWQHIATSFDLARGDARPLVYVDGVEAPLEELYGAPCEPIQPEPRFAIGNVGDTFGRSYDGFIDEVRVAGGLPNAAYLALEYASGAPGFVAVGEPMQLPTD